MHPLWRTRLPNVLMATIEFNADAFVCWPFISHDGGPAIHILTDRLFQSCPRYILHPLPPRIYTGPVYRPCLPGFYVYRATLMAIGSACRLMSDVSIQDHGWVVLITPETDAGRGWVQNNVQLTWDCDETFAVEPRYFGDLLVKMLNAGLTVGGRYLHS
jgi:hypothetical protein